MAKGNVLKDKKITIYKKVITENSMGDQITKYQLVI